MQSLTHSMAQRGAGARTNTRWHPYTPSRASSINSTPHIFRPTPLSQPIDTLTHSSTIQILSPTSTIVSTPHVLPGSSAQPSTTLSRRSSSCSSTISDESERRAKAAVSLVDRTIKCLDEIWKPEYIPSVFAKSKRIIISGKSPSKSQQPQQQSQPVIAQIVQQLPSPITPSIFEQQSYSSESTHPRCIASASTPPVEKYENGMKIMQTEKDLVPIRGFVEHILRRSRLSIPVLQSALCYLEAVRPKVPEIHEREKEGFSDNGSDMSQRISTSEDAEFASWLSARAAGIPERVEDDVSMKSSASADPDKTISMDTAIELDSGATITETSQINASTKRRKTPQVLPPMPPLPSPLLCPRRAFLAALILASKFLQDRCYSNRAWAKLSGLPPREVGRCERALGDALGWRLWVGKGVSASDEPKRSLSRCHSEGLYLTSGSLMPMHQLPSPPLSDTNASPDFGPLTSTTTSTMNSGTHLRSNIPLTRSATVPDQSAMMAVSAFSHAVNSQVNLSSTPTYEIQQSSSLSANGSSATCLTDQMSSTSLMSAETTPRLSFSPNSQTESVLDTPQSQGSSGWSPSRILASGDVKGYPSNSISTSMMYSYERGAWQQSTGTFEDYNVVAAYNQTPVVWGSG